MNNSTTLTLTDNLVLDKFESRNVIKDFIIQSIPLLIIILFLVYLRDVELLINNILKIITTDGYLQYRIMLLFLVLIITSVVLYIFLIPRERMFLTPLGISYQSHFPIFLKWLKPDWSIKWSQITAVYSEPLNLESVASNDYHIVLETALFTKKIMIRQWVEQELSEQVYPSDKEWIYFSQLQKEHVIFYYPIMEYLNKVDITINLK